MIVKDQLGDIHQPSHYTDNDGTLPTKHEAMLRAHVSPVPTAARESRGKVAVS
jgi:hypothetical protein